MNIKGIFFSLVILSKVNRRTKGAPKYGKGVKVNDFFF